MWVITKIGFFNIIEQDDDREKGLLTVKSRSRRDLENFEELIPRHSTEEMDFPIQESSITDYRFRLKAPKDDVGAVMLFLVDSIDYGKTKPAVMENFPERRGIYFGVWETLYEIQCLKENT